MPDKAQCNGPLTCSATMRPDLLYDMANIRTRGPAPLQFGFQLLPSVLLKLRRQSRYASCHAWCKGVSGIVCHNGLAKRALQIIAAVAFKQAGCFQDAKGDGVCAPTTR